MNICLISLIPTLMLVLRKESWFLWYCLQVANGYVRMNATGLLCDAFPMTDYTLTQEEQSDFLEKQYHTLKTMLLDPCHLVRITAVKVDQPLLHCNIFLAILTSILLYL